MSRATPSALQPACWTVSSELGVTLQVSLSSIVSADHHATEPKPDAFGHHFILTGTAASSSHPCLELSHDHLTAISRAMLEEIKTLRHTWLDIADLSTSSHTALQQPALKLSLVPSTTSEQAFYCHQTLVRLDWSDARSHPPWPLSLLLQQTPLSTHLRDLVHRATSSIILETLLTSPSSATLFHRWWRQRRVQIDPLIATIAQSLSALARNSADPAELAPILTRLGDPDSLPTTARLLTLLTRLDRTVFPAHQSPAAWKRVPHQRPAHPKPELDIADLSQSDDETNWLPVQSQRQTLDHVETHSHSYLRLDIVSLPDEPDILDF